MAEANRTSNRRWKPEQEPIAAPVAKEGRFVSLRAGEVNRDPFRVRWLFYNHLFRLTESP
jgi:hypothetical protein